MNLEKVAILASFACIAKFLVEGVSVVVAGHLVNFGHADPMIYATLLGPLWGAHGYITTRNIPHREKVDNPDADSK